MLSRESASDLIYREQSGLLSFFAWAPLNTTLRNDRQNDLVLVNSTSGSVDIFSNINGSHAMANGGGASQTLWFRTISNLVGEEDSATVGFCVADTSVSCDMLLNSQRASAIDLADAVVPYPFYTTGNVLLATSWSLVNGAPILAVYSIAEAEISYFASASVGWVAENSLNRTVTVVGISSPFKSASDFANFVSFSCFRINTTFPSIATSCGSFLHVFAAFQDSAVTRIYFASNVAPRPSFGLVKASIGAILATCTGRATWVEFIRFIPHSNGTHTFFYAPADDGPAVWASALGACSSQRSPCSSLNFGLTNTLSSTIRLYLQDPVPSDRHFVACGVCLPHDSCSDSGVV